MANRSRVWSKRRSCRSTQRKGLDNLPGPLEGITQANGTTVQLESLVMAEVTLWQNGLPVQLAPGQPAVIEMMLPDAIAGQYQAGQTIPAWWFDLDAGQWREEGMGTIQVSSVDPGKLGWVTAVQHFTWWNSGKPWTDKHCFDVLVKDSTGAPMPNIWVNAAGIDYNGWTWPSPTKANGHACRNIKRNGTARIWVGWSQSPFFASTIVTGTGPSANCAGNGTACKQVTLVVPKNPICSPGAFEPCIYLGPAGTEGVGICRASTKYCNITGTGWTNCVGEVLPKPEDCNSPFDDDCDGLLNEEGTGCLCNPGSSTPCYTGPMGTIDVGICKGGARTCQADGIGYGPCLGQVLPAVETCATPEDDNCDKSTSCSGAGIWSQIFRGEPSTNAGIKSTAVNSAGNVVVTGNFSGTVDFGGGPLTDGGVFVAKFDLNGNHLWSKSFVGGGGQSVAIDSAGNVVITGSFWGTVDFGGGPLASAGQSDIFVAKFDPNGNHLWSKRFGGLDGDNAFSTAIDSAGNVVITGDFNGTVDFGGGPLTATAGQSDIFVAKFEPNGNHLWSKRFGDIGSDSATSMAIDSLGNVVLTGSFYGTVDFGGGPLTNAGDNESFVAKFDPDGNHLWSNRFGTASVQSLAIDSAKNVVMTGSFSSSVDFGGGPLDGNGYPKIFVAKFESNGNHLWSKGFGDGGYHEAPSTSTDSVGNIVITGGFWGTLDFGGGPLTTNLSPDDIFVAKFDPNGNHLWSKRFGDTDDFQWARSVAIDGTGNVVIAGDLRGTVDFGNGPLTSNGQQNIFLAKLNP